MQHRARSARRPLWDRLAAALSAILAVAITIGVPAALLAGWFDEQWTARPSTLDAARPLPAWVRQDLP